MKRHISVRRRLPNHRQREITSFRALERLSRDITANLNLDDVFAAIYRGTSELMACDSFFIALYDGKSDVFDFVVRIDQGIQMPPARIAAKGGVARFVMKIHETVNIPDVENQSRFEVQRWGFGEPVRSVCCAPMILQNRVIGVLSAQSNRMDAYDQTDSNILTTLAAQAAIAIQNAQLFEETQRKVRELSVLNEVGCLVSSTIEIDRLLELIYDQLRRIFKADSYHLSLYDPERGMLKFQIIVDEGERFPPFERPIGTGFTSVVIERRAPLLLKEASIERMALGAQPQPIGKPKLSESWLGVPLLASGHLLGVLTVASYEPNVFDESDQEILQNVATQAASAIGNAHHLAEVEDQARRDSLTQVLNHGYFVKSLQNEIQKSQETLSAIALLMLDIDHFKEYNDRYGHLAGDAILRGAVQAMQKNVKRSDLVGRWGGEEFAIALLGTDANGARLVAERIRKTLAETRMRDDQGRPVPVPTVSQGIAMFPADATEAFALVDEADRRLYRAKARGRDQIEFGDPAPKPA